MRVLALLFVLAASLGAQTHVGDGIYLGAVAKSSAEAVNTAPNFGLHYQRWSSASRKSKWVATFLPPGRKSTIAVLLIGSGHDAQFNLRTPLVWGVLMPAWVDSTGYWVPINWSWTSVVTLPKGLDISLRWYWFDTNVPHWGWQRTAITTMQVR